MTGILQTSGDDGGFEHCCICGGLAAGPCARCRKPVCGNCCVLTEGTATPWAVCLSCDRRGGRSLSQGWWLVGAWLLVPLVVLVTLLAILSFFFAPR
jgi:hypothetical protein